MLDVTNQLHKSFSVILTEWNLEWIYRTERRGSARRPQLNGTTLPEKKKIDRRYREIKRKKRQARGLPFLPFPRILKKDHKEKQQCSSLQMLRSNHET